MVYIVYINIRNISAHIPYRSLTAHTADIHDIYTTYTTVHSQPPVTPRTHTQENSPRLAPHCCRHSNQGDRPISGLHPR